MVIACLDDRNEVVSNAHVVVKEMKHLHHDIQIEIAIVLEARSRLRSTIEICRQWYDSTVILVLTKVNPESFNRSDFRRQIACARNLSNALMSCFWA